MAKAYVVNFPNEGSILRRFWENECVIYNQSTGEMHLIDGMGAEIFKLVSTKAVARTQLLQNINSVFELETHFDVEGVLDNLILEYQKLGLLEFTENKSV